MNNMKKYLNKYTYLLFGLTTLIIISIFIIIPNFETEEFSQEVIEDIIDGVTTTSIQSNNEESQTQEVNENNEDSLEISKEETSEITKKFTAFTADKDVAGFDTYLLIGSDERNEKNIETRGIVFGKRADVIILGMVNQETKETTLLSFPRDLLVVNLCTNKLERINATFSRNDCGNSAENLAAHIYKISGIKVNHFASFDFQGFETIIDSVGGIEICVGQTQKEGFSFELQKGCQNTSGLTTLNWVVSRSTEVLVGEKTIDSEGNDNSEWKPMAGVSDLTRIKRQQYVVVQLINELKSFESLNELNKLITALENTFIIDENLTINKAAELLWSFKDFDITKVNKITTPTDYLTLEDGRQVLILNQNLYDFLIKESVIDS
tara:strand:- start:1981 stop:3120 length:1140 start_codon:yes stop_codon:yes gene_type:complete